MSFKNSSGLSIKKRLPLTDNLEKTLLQKTIIVEKTQRTNVLTFLAA